MIHRWPRLTELLERDRDFLRSQSRVSTAVTQWLDGKRDNSYLWLEGRPWPRRRNCSPP